VTGVSTNTSSGPRCISTDLPSGDSRGKTAGFCNSLTSNMNLRNNVTRHKGALIDTRVSASGYQTSASMCLAYRYS